MASTTRILSYPVPVRWAGWRSDTHTLQREGWEFQAEQDIYRQSLRLAMHHPVYKMTGISEITQWEFRDYPDHWHLREREMHMAAVGNVHVIEGKLFKTEARYARMPVIEPFRPDVFHAIDCTPQITTVESQSLDAILHFAPADRKRLILPEDTVAELMGRILELQQPKRQEHFRQQAAASRVVPKLHAQILSIPT